jgi:hypothetical protein
MRRKSFAMVAMLVIAAALMSLVIPSGSINVAFAENDYSQNRSSEEELHSEDEEKEEDDSTRSNDEDDNEKDSDNIRSQDEENGDNGDWDRT